MQTTENQILKSPNQVKHPTVGTNVHSNQEGLPRHPPTSITNLDNSQLPVPTEELPLPYTESPIRAPIAKRILNSLLYSKKNKPKRILEFRRKKVVKEELKRYYKLFEQQNDNPPQEIIEIEMPTTKVIACKPQETRLIKKIRKSAIVRKLNNFWGSKTNQYPTVSVSYTHLTLPTKA